MRLQISICVWAFGLHACSADWIQVNVSDSNLTATSEEPVVDDSGQYMYITDWDETLEQFSIRDSTFVHFGGPPNPMGKVQGGPMAFNPLENAVYALNGCFEIQCSSPAFYRFSVTAATWSTIPGSFQGLQGGHIMTDVTGQALYIMMGKTGYFSYRNDMQRYDISSATLATVSPVGGVKPSARWFYSCAIDQTARIIYIYGGNDRFDGNPEYFDAWQYDISQNTWSQLILNGAGPTCREPYKTSGFRRSSMDFYIMCGSGSFYSLNVVTGLWTTMSPHPTVPSPWNLRGVYVPSQDAVFLKFSDPMPFQMWRYTFVSSSSPSQSPSPSPSPGPSYGSMVGDPVTHYGNNKVDFALPHGEFTELLKTPDLRLFALPKPGLTGNEQWVRCIVVTLPDGNQLLRVEVKPSLHLFNRSTHASNGFETLDVMIGPTAHRLAAPTKWFYHSGNITVTFFRVPPFANSVHETVPIRDAVVVWSPSCRIVIEVSSAVEFYGSSDESAKYAHLDMHVHDILEPELFRGVLPQLWGIEPMSDNVRRLIKRTQVHLRELPTHQAQIQ